MPDKSARRVERPEGGPQGERSESSRGINNLDPGLRRGDDLFRFLKGEPEKSLPE